MRGVNKFFGYAFFVLGASKIILLIFVVLQFVSNLNATTSGAELDTTNYGVFALLIGVGQLILTTGGFVMIILNIKRNPKAIIGYLLCYVAVFLESVLPSIFAMIMLPTTAGIYMKAGSMIKKSVSDDNGGYKSGYKKNSKSVDWFYEER